MKSDKKKKLQFLKTSDQHRSSIASVISASDITEESLKYWQALPEEIRNDLSLAAFKSKNEILHGKD